ncbi:MAG TPA: hypothetical protein VG983_01635 [Caulobacterales bacterium]|nr:hypothetical protein [Caulobacterales bacterium]
MSRSKTGIPGLSFSWRRAIGLSRLESEISRKTGVPLTRAGRERKMGRIFIHLIGWLLLAALAAIGYALAARPEAANALISAFKG